MIGGGGYAKNGFELTGEEVEVVVATLFGDFTYGVATVFYEVAGVVYAHQDNIFLGRNVIF